jgi:hypothetical protein
MDNPEKLATQRNWQHRETGNIVYTDEDKERKT